MKRFITIFWMCMALANPSHAHKASDSYLRLNVADALITGEWSISLRDMELEVGLDRDGNGAITWGEVKAGRAAMTDRLAQALTLTTQAPCPVTFGDMLVEENSDGHYVVLRLQATCAAPIETLTIRDAFLFNRDAQHKSLIALTAGEYVQSAILSTDLREVTLSVHAPGALQQLGEFVRQGMLHIALGFDHLLFLLALLLPAAWIYRDGVRRVDASFREVFAQVFITISAFTLAHAITLALTLFDLVTIRSPIVESLIALTIMLSCLNNLWPWLTQRLWVLAFGFGLIHGIGFATTLTELGLSPSAKLLALLGFNVGVELAQLALVAVLLPIFYTIRAHRAYRVVVVQGFSCIIFLVATVWFFQRSTGIILSPMLSY